MSSNLGVPAGAVMRRICLLNACSRRCHGCPAGVYSVGFHLSVRADDASTFSSLLTYIIFSITCRWAKRSTLLNQILCRVSAMRDMMYGLNIRATQDVDISE